MPPQTSSHDLGPLVEALPLGVILVDADGRVVEANPPACRILDLERQAVLELGSGGAREGPPHPGAGFLAAALALALEPVRARLLGLACGGGSRWLEVMAEPLPGGGTLVLFSDSSGGILANEAARLEQDLLFRESQEAASIGSYRLDLTTGLWHSSAVLDRIFGIGPGYRRDVPGWLDLVHPEDRATMDRYLAEEVVGRRQLFHRDYRIRRRSDGAIRWVLGLGKPLYEGDGPVFGMVGTIQDVTERKLAEAALLESEGRYRSLFEHSQAVMLVVDPDSGALVDANPAAERFYGWPRRELLGKRIGQIDCLGAEPLREALASLDPAAGGHLEARHRLADGSTRWVEAFASHYRRAGEERLFLIIHDITVRHQAEQRVRASEERFQKVFHLAPVIATLSRAEDGTILDVNDQFCSVLGYRREDIRGRRPWEFGLLSRRDRERLMAQFGHGPRLRGADLTLYAKDERPVPCLFSGEIIRFGDETFMVSMMVDMTGRKAVEEERRLLEQQLARTQRLESLGSLAGGVAHDMNNVLAAILSLASVNQLSAAEGSALWSSMDTIARACERGRTLVQGLLTFARQRLAEEHVLDLNELVRDVCRLLERTTLQKVTLALDLDPDLRRVLGDPSALGHALMNLCVNAVDAMPGGGRLAIRTRNEDDDQLLLEVADTGTGMAPGVLEKAMDPFFTTKEVGKGTGLGLSQVYATVKAHRGRVDLASRPGQGTTVSIRLPSSREEAAPPPDREEAPGPAGSLQVLLVDDDELIRESVGLQLEALGHRIAVVASGEQALAWLEQGHPCDAVILDLNMPGLGGAATLPELRRLRPALPVLLATGRTDQTAMDLVASVPGTSLLAKPFTMSDLREGLRGLG